jgi:hypothetical protein
VHSGGCSPAVPAQPPARSVLRPNRTAARLEPGVLIGALDRGSLVGLLNLIDCGRQTAEIALLVANAWQRCGVGTALVAHARGLRDWRGWSIHAEVDHSNFAVMALLRRHPRELIRQSGREMTYRLRW